LGKAFVSRCVWHAFALWQLRVFAVASYTFQTNLPWCVDAMPTRRLQRAAQPARQQQLLDKEYNVQLSDATAST
jgi:hypothetical protein